MVKKLQIFATIHIELQKQFKYYVCTSASKALCGMARITPANFWDSSWIWAAASATNSVRHTKYNRENQELNVSSVVSCDLKTKSDNFVIYSSVNSQIVLLKTV